MISKNNIVNVIINENDKKLEKARLQIDAEIKKQYAKSSLEPISIDLNWMGSEVLVKRLSKEYEISGGWKTEISTGSSYDGGWCNLILS